MEPFNWILTGLVFAIEIACRVVLHITSNVAELGVSWVIFYWLAVLTLWEVGELGNEMAAQSLRGNDIFEVDPNRRGGAWLGAIPAWVLRMKVKWPAWIGTGCLIGGYSGSVMLIVIGIAWKWLALVPAMWAILKILAARRARLFAQRSRVR